MLTDKYIRDLIEEYSKTSEGKKKIKEVIPHRRFVAEYASDEESNRRQIESMCRDMRDILYNHIKEVIPSFQIGDIVIGKIKYDGVSAMVDIQFDADALRRQSLYEKKYPEGVHDIVRLFVKGYKISHDVWGVWHDKFTKGIRYRTQNDFMERAVEEFNSKYSDCAVAELDKIYQN